MPKGIYQHKPNQGFQKGHKPFWIMKGKKRTKEAKKKISLAQTGKPGHTLGKKWKIKDTSKMHHEPWNKGLKGISTSGRKNGAWKGLKVGYIALHSWVRRKLGKPRRCEHCGKESSNPHTIHWANKSHYYKRDLTDWIQLCVPCHSKYDKKL